MKHLTVKHILSLLFLAATSGLIFVVANTPQQTPQVSKAIEATPTPEFVSISDSFFEEEKEEAVVVTRENIPTDLEEEEACVINGEVVKEGTVSSNTICVNEVTPTP